MIDTYEACLFHIDTQLQQNTNLIYGADVVFVCGKSNSFLTTIALKVGELQRIEKNILHKEETTLAILNNEISRNNLLWLLNKIDVSRGTRVQLLFNGIHLVSPLNVLKQRRIVVVDSGPSLKIEQCNDILLEMSMNQLTGMVIVHRFMTTYKDIEPGLLMRYFKRNIRGHGLKVLFIESVRDKETRMVNLGFSNKPV